jgi:TPR repeat protein
MKDRFFSQEMASSSSHSNKSIPLAIVLEWYKIRDTFFGHNFAAQNIPLALEICASCDHPDARWLTEACAGKNVTTKEDAKRVFSALGQNDARALCFSWLCRGEDLSTLRRSAELGFAFAQAWMAVESQSEEKFKFAQLAASQGERMGLCELGRCLRNGIGCEVDLDRAKESLLVAAKFNHGSSMFILGQFYDETDQQVSCKCF